MKKASNSNLSQRILFALSRKSASSVTDLARDLGLLRPSVSRAVSSLQNAGLISRQGRTLLLTEAGQEELRRLSAELPAMVKKTADQAVHTLERIAEQQSLMEAIINSPSIQAMRDLAESPFIQASKVESPLIQAMRGIGDISLIHTIRGLGDIPTVPGIGEFVNNPNLLSVGVVLEGLNIGNPISQLGEAIAAISQTQRINLDFLQMQESPFNSIGRLFIENNVFISSMIADLGTIASAGRELNSSLVSLGQQTLEATRAYDTLFRSASETLAGGVTREQTLADYLRTELVIPTTTTSSLVGSTRNIIQARSFPQSEEALPVELAEVHVYSQQYIAMSTRLEHYLNPLSERFVSKWHGAWQTLFSKSEDRHSQAMHSARELLMQVLAHLAPDELFTEEEIARNDGKPPTRRMRIRRILSSDSKAEWVDKTATALNSTYDVLAAESHSRDDEYRGDDTAAGQLIVLGGLLLTLLSRRSNNPT